MSPIKNEPALRLGLPLLAVATLTLFVLPVLGIQLSAAENGPLENAQALLIVAACLTPLYYCTLTTSVVARHLLATTALLPFSFFFREVEIKDLNVPDWLIFIGSGLPNQLLVAALWMAVLISLLVIRKGIIRMWWHYLWSQPAGYLLLFCFLALLSAGFIEKGDITVSKPLYYEEVVELMAYAVLLIAAVTSRGAAQTAVFAEAK